jgi:hypothetical protein
MAPIFPNRTDWLHLMRLIKETDGNPGHVRVFGATHENSRSALRTEKLVKSSASIGWAGKLL